MWEIQEAEGKQPGAGPEQGESPAKFYFYFGTKDHWVADECRDEFIERRRQHEKGRTRVVIDEGGVPHAFCIRKWIIRFVVCRTLGLFARSYACLSLKAL